MRSVHETDTMRPIDSISKVHGTPGSTPRELYRLLRRQIAWAGKEATQLQAEWETIRPQRERAWREKEAIFDDLIDAEIGLFSAMVGSVPPAHLTTSLEKLQQQQQQFQDQQDQLVKSAEVPTVEGST